VPAAWLGDQDVSDAATVRAAYVRYLVERAAAPRRFVEAATGAR
jgi:hypothetical protein